MRSEWHLGSLTLRPSVCGKVQSSGIRIDGTFCEYTVAYVKHVVHIPDRLDSPSAAVIMCAVSPHLPLSRLALIHSRVSPLIAPCNNVMLMPEIGLSFQERAADLGT